MERKDAYLIIILMIISVLLGYAIIVKKPPTAYITKPGQKPNIISFFLKPKQKQPEFRVEEVIKGMMVLNSEKGYELSDQQKQQVKDIFNNVKKKQEEYNAIKDNMDKLQSELEGVLTTKQLKYLKENRYGLMSMLQEVDKGKNQSQDLMEKLEDSLKGGPAEKSK